MSWIARSLANSLIPDHRGEDDEEDDREARIEKRSDEDEEENHQIESETLGRGVKEDLSELTKTLTRQFWGVASFLAPPPSSQEPSPTSSVQISSDPSDPTVSRDSEEEEVSESPRIAGIRNDFAEIGGRFRTGISRLSNNKAVSEISKIASTFLPFGSEEDEDEEYDEKYGGGAIGVTDEVLAFARNISMHSETWLDFPLFPVDEDSDDFDMSDAQQEHALAVERLAPRLAALRIELCPSHMSEGCFWKIYFVLLHPRLSKHDAELLSTPQIVEARAMLLQELQNRRKPDSERPATGASYRGEALSTLPPKEEVAMPSSVLLCETAPPIQLAFGEPTISVPITDFETDKHPVITTEVKIIDKSVIEEEPLEKSENKDFHSDDSRISVQRDEEDGDDWLEEETGEMGNSGGTNIPLENEEDVSFSDLEEEDDGSAPKSSKTVTHAINSQTKDSKGWVQLNKSSANAAKGSNSATSPETKESNDWLSVDDIDVV